MPRPQLLELYAHGLGVIQEARLEFGSGFNVLTGETGAGKTLLLGALDLCLGGDGPNARETLKPDMRAAAVFDVGDGREVVLTRESGTSGRLRSAVDGASSSAEALRTLAQSLIVIHGQHDSLILRNRAEILRIIDASAAISTEEYDAARRTLHDALSLREKLGGDTAARERELELVQFLIDELEAVRITSSLELDETLLDLTRLSELRDGQAALVDAIDVLDADSDAAVLTRFAQAIARLPPGDAYDPSRTQLRSALEQARDAIHELATMTDPDAFDSAAMKELEDRATVLQQVARKFGGTLEMAMAELSELRERREIYLDARLRVASLDVEITDVEALVVNLAAVLCQRREKAARELTRSVAAQLPRVALAHATLRFVIDGAAGAEAQILFAPNPGHPEGPLQSLASGGELSRVLLALSLETSHDNVVSVFDEVDAGVGGQVAQQIGECLREVGRQQQVLAITHLASVAAKADHHFVVEKFMTASEVTTVVRVLTGDDRVDEIARMLAGDEITSESRALARQLLETQRS